MQPSPAMELLYSFILTVPLLLLLIKLTGGTFFNRPKTQRLPPGPWNLPVIGSLHHLIGAGLPHRSLRDLSNAHGPIMHLKLGEVPTYILSTPEASREILKTHDVTFASRPLLNAVKVISYGGLNLGFAPYGEFWKKLRRITVTELLSVQRVRSFQSIREEEVLGFLRSISASASASADPVINLTHSINSLVNDIAMRAIIGSKCEDQATLLTAMNEAIDAGGGIDLVDLFPTFPLIGMLSGSGRKAQKIRQKLDPILDGIIQEHRDRRADDLLDALLRQQDDPDTHLSNDTLKAVVLDVIMGGSETSATALAWTMTELVRNPRVLKKVQSEIRELMEQLGRPLAEADVDKLSYLKLVIKEGLRMHAPLPLLLRECQSTCKVLGYEIPAKARVMVNMWAINRDTRYWGDDAEEFRPERFEEAERDYKGANFEYMPFGAGRRICPGMSFGVANVEHPLAQLLCYFDWELPKGVRSSDLDMSETLGVTARMKSDLHLKVIPRIPCP